MDIIWRYLLWILQLSLNVEGIYHLRSMQEFVPPTKTSKDSLFGYSIAYQPTTKRLIISAPNNDDIGKIYDCNIQNKQCLEIRNNIKDYKFKKMWLGATVATSQNFTMACAPRYIEERKKTGTFGKCFASSPSSHNMTQLKSIREEDQVKDRVFELDMDSFGWSIDVTKHGTVLVGGPAMYKGRVIAYYTIDETPRLLNFTKGSTWQIQFNYGYSVVSGHFTSKNSDEVIFAISSPYGGLGLGLVILFNGKKPSVLVNPRPYSPPVGAMFGAAMAAANLLVGQPQALLVGAPAYYDKWQGQVDIGAVYIYQYDEKSQTLTHQKTILGQANKGRFGSSIISLGDLNDDGKHEIAISAPYEGSGVVYVYSGAHLLSMADTKELRWLQRIQPSMYKAFGLSMTALQDYDGNGYNELAIGVPDSNRVVLLSCMSKITLKVNTLKPYPRAYRNDTHFLFQSCVDIKYPAKPDHITAEIEVIVGNVTHATARLVNAQADGSINYTINIKSKNQTHECHDVGIMVPMEVGYHPMIQYQIKAIQLNSPELQMNFNAARALLSDLSELEISHAVWVADCSGKDECKPELSFHVNTTIPNNYVIGSSVKETMSVVTVNRGDVAYSPCMNVYMMGVQVLQPPPTCHLQLDREGEVLFCQPSTPVKNNTAWESGAIELDIKKLNSDSREITFRIELFPLCGSNESSSKTLTRQLRADSSMIVRGANIGDTVKVTEEELEKTGKILTHDYSIYNNGTTDWVNIKCEITLLEKKPFFKDSNANIEASALSSCTMETEEDKIVCIVEELKVNQKFVLILPLYVLPGKLHEDEVNGKNIVISSHLKLIYGDYQQEKRVTSKIKMRYGVVPLWIIIIAALVGLLIICIIIFALYECGFLRRKNKDKLQRLRKSVYRQSIRRSQIHESMRSGQRKSGERQKLLEQMTANERDDILDEKSPTDGNGKQDHDSARKIYPKADDKDTSRTLPEEGEECKIKKKEQIIKGLQKNLDLHRSNQFLAPRHKENITEESNNK